MTKNPSRKLWEVLFLKIPQVIRIHIGEWEVVVVCCPRRGIMRILIIPQVIRIPYLKFGEWQWEVVVVLVRRGVKILADSDILAITTIDLFGLIRLCL